MKIRIHHVAVKVNDLEWYVDFFQNVLGMTIEKTKGDD